LTWTVTVDAKAVRDLRRIPEKVYPAIAESFLLLEDNPLRVGKPLRGEREGTWSLRRGEFRILYQLDEPRQRVRVMAVGHRSDVYRPGR
jgi:mRNA interferase RelE/StbE